MSKNQNQLPTGTYEEHYAAEVGLLDAVNLIQEAQMGEPVGNSQLSIAEKVRSSVITHDDDQISLVATLGSEIPDNEGNFMGYGIGIMATTNNNGRITTRFIKVGERTEAGKVMPHGMFTKGESLAINDMILSKEQLKKEGLLTLVNDGLNQIVKQKSDKPLPKLKKPLFG